MRLNFCWLFLFVSSSSSIALIGAIPVPVAISRISFWVSSVAGGANVNPPAGPMYSISSPSFISLSQVLPEPPSMAFTQSWRRLSPGLFASE